MSFSQNKKKKDDVIGMVVNQLDEQCMRNSMLNYASSVFLNFIRYKNIIFLNFTHYL